MIRKREKMEVTYFQITISEPTWSIAVISFKHILTFDLSYLD